MSHRPPETSSMANHIEVASDMIKRRPIRLLPHRHRTRTGKPKFPNLSLLFVSIIPGETALVRVTKTVSYAGLVYSTYDQLQ